VLSGDGFPKEATKLTRLYFQAASAKQAKLAALRKWTHINPDTEEIRLELEDKILNGLLTFDLASRQETPAESEETSNSRITAQGSKGTNSETASKRSNTTANDIDQDIDSGDESDLAPQVEALLKRVRGGPKIVEDADDAMDDEQLNSDDWPPSEEDVEEEVPDSADEMEDAEEKAESKAQPNASPPPDEPKEMVITEATLADASDVGDNGIMAKRYDLGKMAEGGHGGRIMFIFQKVSDGKRKGKA
jgi:hypothetical protein